MSNMEKPLGRYPLQPSTPEHESRSADVDRLWTEEEAGIIRDLRELRRHANDELPDRYERLNAGIETVVFRDEQSPGVVYKIPKNPKKPEILGQMETLNRVAQQLKKAEEVQIGDHSLKKIADGVPACAFIKDEKGDVQAVIVEEAKPAKDWGTAAKVIPVLEEQGLYMKDFRETENIGEIEREDGRVETVALDFGGVRIISEMTDDERLYKKIRKSVMKKAEGGPVTDLR